MRKLTESNYFVGYHVVLLIRAATALLRPLKVVVVVIVQFSSFHLIEKS